VVHEEILRRLERARIPFEVHAHEPVTTVDQARERVPHLLDGLIKTVVFRTAEGLWVLAAVEAGRRVHYKRLADALGRSRTELRPVSPEEVERQLGFQVGGVGPFPSGEGVRVVLDQAVTRLERVRCGSGRNDRTLTLRTEDLIRLTTARIHPIGRD
jgi:Cys-tRNA(Pro)/Cys-tRNA(Cys) deacylase